MITHYRVLNFKNLVDVAFDPEPLNVIVGANGSGKTSLLQSMDFLRALFMSSLELYVRDKGWELRDLRNIHRRSMVLPPVVPPIRRVSNTLIVWQVVCELPSDSHGSEAGTYAYEIHLRVTSPARVVDERLYLHQHGRDRLTLLERNETESTLFDRDTNDLRSSHAFSPLSSVMATIDPVRDKTKYPDLVRFREWVEGFRLFSIWDPKILRSADRGKHLELGPNGEHLAPFLALLKQKHPDDFSKLLVRIKRIFPHVSDITLTGGRGWGWREIQQHEGVNGSKGSLRSQQMSDGVLRLLAIASLLYVENTPSVIMVEEPENGIHPQLLREVVGLLRELTLQKPPRRRQVFFTTHTPYMLDEFIDHEHEVFLMDRDPSGLGASISQLSLLDVQQRAALTEQFSLGEQWFSGLIGGTAKGTARGS